MCDFVTFDGLFNVGCGAITEGNSLQSQTLHPSAQLQMLFLTIRERQRHIATETPLPRQAVAMSWHSPTTHTHYGGSPAILCTAALCCLLCSYCPNILLCSKVIFPGSADVTSMQWWWPRGCVVAWHLNEEKGRWVMRSQNVAGLDTQVHTLLCVCT